MDKGELKITLSAGQMQGLYRAHSFLVKHYDVHNDHELLLLHHAIEFREKYKKLLQNKQKKYGIKLTYLGALAFCQIWEDDYRHLQEYERTIIYDIYARIDQYRKTLNTQTHGEENIISD